jgi:hypothetical protein
MGDVECTHNGNSQDLFLHERSSRLKPADRLQDVILANCFFFVSATGKLTKVSSLGSRLSRHWRPLDN